MQIKKTVFVGGLIQVLGTIGLTFASAKMLNLPFNQSIFIGFLISLSSTAIVLKLIQDKGEIDAPYGKTVVGILIFQDIIAIPMMLVTPLLSGKHPELSEPVYLIAIKFIVIIASIILGAKYIVPAVLHQVVKTRINELFLMTVLVICIGVASLTSSLGLSLALGAFIAGLIISESDYSHQALGFILPFKTIFTSFFFVSVGMLLDISFFIHNFVTVILLTSLVLIIKFLAGSLASVSLGNSLRTAIIAGLSISQVGEFSFVLSKVGLDNNLLDQKIYQIFLSVSVLTMIITPFSINIATKMADIFVSLPFLKKLESLKDLKSAKESSSLKDHLVIIGFGLNGKNLAKVATRVNIPYAIIDTNPKTVKKYSDMGQLIFYGDATSEVILEHVNIRQARVVTIAISDPAATRRVVSLIRSMDKSVCIIVRTRYLTEVEELHTLGADQVITEEFETSIEIFTRVLNKYFVPKDEVENFIDEFRERNYQVLRNLSRKNGTVALNDVSVHTLNTEIATLKISSKSKLIDKSLSEIDMRKNYGVNVLILRRDDEVLPSPDSEMKLKKDDVLVLFGDTMKINQVESLF